MQENTFSGTRSLNQNRYAFSFEYKSKKTAGPYVLNTSTLPARLLPRASPTSTMPTPRTAIRMQKWNSAQGVYGLVIAPLAQLPKNSRIDVKARYDMYQPNGKSNMQRTQYEAGLNFHIGKRISILTEYALINDKTLAKQITRWQMPRFASDSNSIYTKARSCYRNEPLLCLLSTTYLKIE